MNLAEKNYIAVLRDYEKKREIKKPIRATSLNTAYLKAQDMQTKRMILESVLLEGVK